MAPFTLTSSFVAKALFGGGAIMGFVISMFFVRRVYNDGVGIFPSRYAPVSDNNRRRAGIAHMIMGSLVAGGVVAYLGVAGVFFSNLLILFIPDPVLVSLFAAVSLTAVLYGLLTVLELGSDEQEEVLLQFVMTVSAIYVVSLLLHMVL